MLASCTESPAWACIPFHGKVIQRDSFDFFVWAESRGFQLCVVDFELYLVLVFSKLVECVSILEQGCGIHCSVSLGSLDSVPCWPV